LPRFPRDLLARAYAAQRFAVVAAGTAGLPAAAAAVASLGAPTALYLAATLITSASTTALGFTQRRGRSR
jgi:hypothetical protein